MALTVANLITSIRYTIKDTAASKFASDNAELLDYVQRAYEMLYQRLIELQSDINLTINAQALAAGTGNYDLPADFQAWGFVHIAGESKRMDQVNYDNILAYDELFGSNSDTPTRFAIYNDDIYIKPTPDAVYTMNEYYYAHPSTLATSTTMPFAGIFNRAIQRWVERMCLNRDEFDIKVEDAETKLLLSFAEGVHRARNKSLKRINAYRWEYQGLV